MSEGTPQKPSRNPSEIAQSTRLPSIPSSIKEEEDDDDDDNEGSPNTIRQSASSTIRRDYGALESSDGTVRHRPTQRPPSPPNLAQSSPQINKNQKRPLAARRMSTRKSLPHRGEQFSVDDDPFEVEEDRAESFPTLKRTPSHTRRRPTALGPTLPRIESQEIDEEPQQNEIEDVDIVQDRVEGVDDDGDILEFDDDDGDDTLSEAESFTLRDRQLAINQTHPFGIRIWKPALYKKNRSVEKNAEEDIHSSPSQIVGKWLWIVNCLWTVIFGWWLALLTALAAVICFILIFEPSAVEYGRVFWGLSGYLFWPFGKFVKLEQDEQYAEEDEGEGRSISEYERWQSGDLEYGRLMFGPTAGRTGSIVGRHRNSMDSVSERDHLLGRSQPEHIDTGLTTKPKRRLFGRGQWTLGRMVFFGIFYFVIAPLMLLVSLTCWLFVFTIPMGRVLLILFSHLRKRPLALSFHPDVSYVRDTTKPSSILLCTYRAAGLKYWKYTVDGTNIFLINFLAIVVLVIFDYLALKEGLELEIWLTSPALMFPLALVSIIPLAYFIGQAVASISAQSSMGMGAAVNAFFSTIVEVYLYCVALNEGKGALVEGSIIGSIFAGLLLLPGLSMCFGAIKRKTQRFNVKSAGATTTMLLFAIIATFGPTLFYKIYGSHELICMSCTDLGERDCRRCYFRQIPAINDEFFVEAVRPYCWGAAICLFLSYIIGLLFTLRTHAAVIWTTEIDEKKPIQSSTAGASPQDTRLPSMATSQTLRENALHVTKHNIRESQLYSQILGQSLRSAGLTQGMFDERAGREISDTDGYATDRSDRNVLPHLVPPKTPTGDITKRPVVPGLSEEENNSLVQQVAELAATAATIAARDVVQHPKTTSYQLSHSSKHDSLKVKKPSALKVHTTNDDRRVHISPEATAVIAPATNAALEAGGGHDAPNWSRTKSSVILVTATIAYAIIAEILVDTVDVVLENVTIDEKFLGITLFALVPNTTEFLNAISFAMNGNIALSMEIGSAYVLQVCLLQIPALVLFTAVKGMSADVEGSLQHTFNLIFPQWDMVTVILCVILLTHVYGEGKSNYFKGSILVLTYLVVVLGFWFSGYTSMDIMGVDPSDTLAIVASGWTRPQSGQSAVQRLTKKSEL